MEALRLRLSTRSIACRSLSHHRRSMKRFSATVPVKCARCTACSSVTVVAPVTRSRRATNTVSRPASSSVNDIALQRTIGMGILVVVVTATLAEEAPTVALSSSSTSADIALHRTMVIMCVVLLVGLRECLPFIHLPCTDSSDGTTALQLLY